MSRGFLHRAQAGAPLRRVCDILVFKRGNRV